MLPLDSLGNTSYNILICVVISVTTFTFQPFSFCLVGNSPLSPQGNLLTFTDIFVIGHVQWEKMDFTSRFSPTLTGSFFKDFVEEAGGIERKAGLPYEA